MNADPPAKGCPPPEPPDPPGEGRGGRRLLPRLRRALGKPTPRRLLGVLGRGASATILNKLAGQVLKIGLGILVARLIGHVALGELRYLGSWVTVVSLFGGLGLAKTAVRFVASYHRQGMFGELRGFVLWSRAAMLLSSTLAGGLLVLVVSAPDFGGAMPRNVCLGAVAGMVVLRGQRNLSREILRGLKAIGAGLALDECLGPVLTIAALLHVQRTYPGVVDLGLVLVVQALIGFVAAAALALAVRRRLGPEVAAATPAYLPRDWHEMGFQMMALGGLQAFMGQFDILMLGAMGLKDQVGLYSVANRLSSFALVGLVAMNVIVAPMVADAWSTRDQGEMRWVLRLAGLGNALLGFPILAGLLVFGRELLGLYGPAFGIAYPVLVVLVAGQMVNAAVGPVGILLAMSGNQGVTTRVVSASAILNLVLNLLLIPPFGAVGAAAAMAVAMALTQVRLHQMARELVGQPASPFVQVWEAARRRD